ncbi:MAG: DUF1844 domain-containing protein [Euryarchaeota archaeon]|jgi:hypothetical protein|nr:DUF1844 domain-containing protein [Euryarchaeota archaeon]
MSEEDLFTNEGSARFFTVIHMFQRSALVNMGYIADHEGLARWNPTEAKESIDILTTLQDKTAGNLHSTEEQMLRGVISELQMQFVRAPEVKRQQEEAEKESEIIKEAFANPRDGPAEVMASDNEEE